MTLFDNTVPRSVLGGLGLFFLAGFFFLSTLIGLGRFVTTDFTLMVKVQDKIAPRFDSVLATVVEFASVEIISVVLFVVVVLLPIKRRFKLLLLATYVGGMSVVMAGKVLLHHPAPPYMFHREATGLSFPLTHVQVEYSYPSGHTFRAVFVGMTVILGLFTTARLQMFKLVVSTIVAGGVCLILAALVVLGKHWVSDIAGGALLAAGLVFVLFALMPHRQRTVAEG